MESDTLCTVVDVSLASSQLQIPFSTNPGALTIIQCDAAVRYIIGCIIMYTIHDSSAVSHLRFYDIIIQL